MRENRALAIGGALVFLLGLALGFVPAFGGPGYEVALEHRSIPARIVRPAVVPVRHAVVIAVSIITICHAVAIAVAIAVIVVRGDGVRDAAGEHSDEQHYSKLLHIVVSSHENSAYRLGPNRGAAIRAITNSYT